MPDPVKFEVSIPSDTTVAQDVQERIISELERRSYTSRDVFGVRLALEEAITNAIRHGNGNDKALKVEIVCEITDDLMHVEIQDQGPGFRPESVPDPTTDDNLDQPGGRGVLLMNAYMSLVAYNDSGNRVILEKSRTVESPESQTTPRADT